MAIDERRLSELIVESEDLQADGLRHTTSALRDWRDLDRDRSGQRVDSEMASRFNLSRRQLLLNLGAKGALAGVLGGGIGAALATLLARPAAAAPGLDVQILQTASSLERLAINAYTGVLALPFIKGGNKIVLKFAQTTMAQHDAHGKAFQAKTTGLGGAAQDAPNPRYAPVIAQAMPSLKTPADVLRLAANLEIIARDTYLSDLAQLTDTPARSLMASVMGVEAQHLAILRTMQTLIQGGTPQLVASPVDLNALPAAAGSAAFPDGSIPLPTLASPAPEGALP